MATRKSGKQWTRADKSTLRSMARQSASTSAIARRLGRTKGAVYKDASKLRISLKPKHS